MSPTEFDKKVYKCYLFTDAEIFEKFNLIGRFDVIGSSIYGPDYTFYNSDTDTLDSVLMRVGTMYGEENESPIYIIDDYCLSWGEHKGQNGWIAKKRND